MPKRGFSLILSFLFVVLCYQVIQATNIRLTNNSASSENPAIATDEGGISYVAWQDNRDGNWEIYFCKADNNGNKLVDDTNVSNTSGSSTNPDISIDSLGNSYLTWLEGGSVYYCKLNQSGDVVVVPKSVGSTEEAPAISTSPIGISSIVWKHLYGSIRYLYFCRMDSSGEKIGGNLDIWDTVYPIDIEADIYTDNDGFSNVVYRRDAGWFDYRLTWCRIDTTGSITNHGYIYDSDDAVWPSIYANTTSFWVAFQENEQIKWLRDINDAIPIGSAGHSYYPEIVVDTSSHSFTVWQDNRNGNWDIYLQEVDAPDILVGENILITDDPADSKSPDMSIESSGACCIVWQDNRDGNWEIYFESAQFGPFDALIHVENAGNPVDGATVWVDRGNGPESVGETDNNGNRQVSDLRSGYKIWAHKMVYARPVVKTSHQAVDGIMYELHMDTKTLQHVGNSGSQWEWRPKTITHKTPTIELDLNHPVFEWNLVVATEWDIPNGDAYYSDLVAGLDNLSKYLYNATDGQMKLNKVAIYDNRFDDKLHWKNADLRIYAGNNYPTVWTISKMLGCFEYEESPIETHDGFMKGGRRLVLSPAVLHFDSPADRDWSIGFTHEMGHYVVGLGEEYMLVRGDSCKDKKTKEERPWWFHRGDNFGLMADAKSKLEMSSSSEYLCGYNPDRGNDWTTHQWWLREKSCWDWVDYKFSGDYNGIVVKMATPNGRSVKINPPEPGCYAEGHRKNPRLGPLLESGEVSPVNCTHSSNAFNANVTVRQPIFLPASGSKVVLIRNFQSPNPSDIGEYSLGKTDAFGHIEAVGLDIVEGNPETYDKLLVTWKDWHPLFGTFSYSGEKVIDTKESSYTITVHSGKSLSSTANIDSLSPKLIVDAGIESISTYLLNLKIAVDESLSGPPSVQLYLEDGNIQTVIMEQEPGSNAYSGTADIDTNLLGFIQVEATDTTGNHASALNSFSIDSLKTSYSNDVFNEDGIFELSIPGVALSSDEPIIVQTSNAVPPPPDGDNIRLLGDVYSAQLTGGQTSLLQPASLNIGYVYPDVAGMDESSLAIYKWNFGDNSWENLGGEIDFDNNTISVEINELSVFAVFGEVSSDTIPPCAISDLSASTGSAGWGIDLVWTSAGDDDTIGMVTSYLIRYNSVPLSEANWDSSIAVGYLPEPKPAGMLDSLSLEMSEPDKAYHFAIKTMDEAGNISPISNIATAKSRAQPDVPLLVSPPDASEIDTLTPTFVWKPTAGDSGWYIFEYALDDSFTQGVFILDSLQDTTYTVPDSTPLSNATVYYWHVEGFNKYGDRSYFQWHPFSFIVDTSSVYVPAHQKTELPKAFSLSQNFPNPFNPVTTIKYALPKDSPVKLTIYNILGQRVITLVDERQRAGYKSVCWDSRSHSGNEVASGIYFYRLKAGGFVKTRKMILLR